jgi:hypothetical protein
MTYIIEVARRGSVAISFSRETHDLDIGEWNSYPSVLTVPGEGWRQCRILVEAMQRLGGHLNRALIGGVVDADFGEKACFRVDEGTDLVENERISSRLWNQPFRPGLPSDYLEAASEGLLYGLGPQGASVSVTVDVAGFDEVSSSSGIFRKAASVLGRSMVACTTGKSAETAVRDLMNEW